MNEKLRTLVFSVAVTALFGLLVSGLQALLLERTQLNRRAAEQRVIMTLLGLTSPTQGLTNEQVATGFPRSVREVFLTDAQGATLTAFLGAANEQPISIGGPQDPEPAPIAVPGPGTPSKSASLLVVPFSGQGFWEMMHGYLAIDPKTSTIRGIAFTRHGETPGLGGRISDPDFPDRVIGRSFASPSSDGRRIRFVPAGSAKGAAEIDGITGATGTTSALDRILNQALARVVAALSPRSQNP